MTKGRYPYHWSLGNMRARAESHLLDDSSASRALANMVLDLVERIEKAEQQPTKGEKTMATIDITSRFNTERIQKYADEHQTRDPQSHIAARLELLAELSNLVDADAERDGGDPMTFETLVWEIQRRHKATTNEFLGFFGGPEAASEEAAPEFRNGPSDEVLIALAKQEYGSDDIEIDGNAVVSRGDDPGAFVAAWVWVAFPDES